MGLLAVASFACACFIALAVCQATQQGQWSTGSLSAPRYLLAATSVRDQVIFAGGGSGSTHNCRVDRYSAVTDSWSQECLSVARSWLSATSVSFPAPSSAAFSLVAGGYTTTASNVIDIFNAQTLSWSVSPVSLSVARFSMAAASLDSLSLAFFAGGREFGSSGVVCAIVDVLKLTPSGGITATVLNMSVPRHALCAASLPQQSVVIFAGGFTSTGSSSRVVDMYNAETQDWTVASLSAPRAYLAATTLASYSLAFFAGGWTGTSTTGACSNVVDIYNGATKSWSQATLSVARHFLAAAALELQGIAVFAGGLKTATQSFTGQYSNDVDIFIASSNTWSTHTLTTARSFLVPAVLPLRGLLYLGGGFTGAVSGQIDAWDVRADSLGPLSPAITLSNPARGGSGISMTISMTPASPIPVNGKIIVTLPGSFNCSDGAPVVFSPRGTPARSGAVSIYGSLMTISILSGVFLGGASFSMSFTGVTNPSAPQAFSPAVNGATLNENGLTIGSSTIGNLVAVVPNLGPSQPSIALSGVLASQKDVTMTISLLPEVAIPSTGRLLITLSGQGWKIPENSAAVFSSPASGAVASASILDSSDSSNVLLVQFVSGVFPANEPVTFRIAGVANPPLGQAPASKALPKPTSFTATMSAIRDPQGSIVGASVRGTLPVIINALGCGADSYFDQTQLQCTACASGKGSPEGSTSETACKDKVDIIGVSVGVPISLLVVFFSFVARHMWIWSRRHKVFELFADSHHRASLMKETSNLPRPEEKIKLYDITEAEHPHIWTFVKQKMGSSLDRPRNDKWRRKIVKMEFCRAEREDTFLSQLFDSARAEVEMADALKYTKTPEFQNEITREKCPQFYEGLERYQSFCEDLNVKAKVGSKTLTTTKETPSRPGINLMFAWHAGYSDKTKSLCEIGIQQAAISTDAGYFGKGSYLSPDFDYSEVYATMDGRNPVWIDTNRCVWIQDKNGFFKQEDPASRKNSQPDGSRPCYAVILWACAVPLTPYVVTKRDYPLAEPPFRDAAVPYGFSKFYGRPMERACSAHFISVKDYGHNVNPLRRMYDKSDIPSQLQELVTRKKYIRTNQGYLQHVCVACPRLPEHWIEQKDHLNNTIYINRIDGSTHVAPPDVLEHPDVTRDPHDPKGIFPHILQHNFQLDYQYCPVSEAVGHELVLQHASMALPVAVVYVTFEEMEDQPQPSAPPLEQADVPTFHHQPQSVLSDVYHHPSFLPPVGGFSQSSVHPESEFIRAVASASYPKHSGLGSSSSQPHPLAVLPGAIIPFLDPRPV